MSADAPSTATEAPVSNPDNLTGVDYHHPPARKVPSLEIVDIHNHTREPALTKAMVDAGKAYGVTRYLTMAGLEHVEGLKKEFPGLFNFVAVPAWQNATTDPEFFKDWHNRVDKFFEHGARLIKFHAAPGTMRRWGISLDDPRIQEIAKHAYDLGYHMMTHVGDPLAWFYGKGVYADGTYGTLPEQFAQLERMLDKYHDRLHLGAHMGGSLETLDLLAKRLDKFPNYVLDMSATKWMVRAVAEQSVDAVRDFIIHYQDRILWGTDNVVTDKRDWAHYASRFWVHQMLWESSFDGDCPMADPDGGHGFSQKIGTFDATTAPGKPLLRGVNLPTDVLRKIYRTNAERLLLIRD